MDSAAHDDIEEAPQPARLGKAQVLVRMDARVHDTRRRIAFDERVSSNKLTLDDLAEVLRKRGR